MSGTHEVVRLAAFDQFPYTHHLEAGVLLVKKEGAAPPPPIPDAAPVAGITGAKRKANGDGDDDGDDENNNGDQDN
jgi:hypothetical protein